MVNLLLFLLFPFSVVDITSDETIILNKLENQAHCWNSGNIDCFMQDYWHDDSLMYIGKNGVTYGWQNTLDNYKLKYPTKTEMGELKFQLVQLEQLSIDHYFMVGKWQLTRQAGDIEGHFTLIWKKIDNNWVIVADHSS
jgi:hypothetical protein